MSNSQIQRRPADQLSGTYSEPKSVNEHMAWAQENAHLVSPATAVGAIPDGCGVALSVVTIDAALDTYSTGGGKYGLSKTALQKIGHAAGISWDPIASGRVDDGSHPYYVRWRAVGTYKAFDGQTQTLHAEKEFDLRDGSPQIAGKSEKQIGEMRTHAQSHAETKAQLRAIRSLGIKTGYTQDELKKPFVAARIAFTGRSADPEMQREFSRMTAESFLGGRQALYTRSPMALSDPSPAPARLAAPPPVGTSVVDDDDDFPPSYRETTGEPQPQARPQQAAGENPPQQQAHRGAPPSGSFTIPGGKDKGKALADASNSSIEWWCNTIGENLSNGSSKYPDKDKALHAALCAEIAKREAGAL